MDGWAIALGTIVVRIVQNLISSGAVHSDPAKHRQAAKGHHSAGQSLISTSPASQRINTRSKANPPARQGHLLLFKNSSCNQPPLPLIKRRRRGGTPSRPGAEAHGLLGGQYSSSSLPGPAASGRPGPAGGRQIPSGQ